MSEIQIPFPTPISRAIFYNKYSRWDHHLGRRETKPEAIGRAFNFLNDRFHEMGGIWQPGERELVESSMHRLEALPSMRLLWSAGPALRNNHVMAYNCSFMVMNALRKFSEALFILMSGTGVGYSVEAQYVSDLPKIKRQKNVPPSTWVIGDSTEGWCDALNFGIETWWNGLDCTFDGSQVRPAGSILKTKGGRASGVQPLLNSLQSIRTIILNGQGRNPRPIMVHDIMCLLAQVVVVGGIRRSSLISLFDMDDMEMRMAKHGEFWNATPWRAMANNSIVYNEKPTNEQLLSIWSSMIAGHSGEPGIFNRECFRTTAPRRKKYRDVGTNPCLVAGTMVMTREGHFPIEQLVGKTVEVWDGYSWRLTDTFRVTGENQPVTSVHLSNGQTVTATPYHKFILADGKRVELRDLTVGSKLMQHSERTLKYRIKPRDITVTSISQSGVAEKVFCCTIPGTHSFALSSGVLVGQCGEILLRDSEFCVKGNTKLITRLGIQEIQDVVNRSVEIWNGQKWSSVIVRKTGQNQQMVRVSISDGSYLECTPDHRFSVKHRFQHDWSSVAAGDLMSTTRYALQVQPTVVVPVGGQSVKRAYELGIAVGDGCVYKNKVIVDLYGPKMDLVLAGAHAGKTKLRPGYAVECNRTNLDVEPQTVTGLKNDVSALNDLFTWDRESVLKFVAGLIDTDGSETGTGGVRLYGSGEERMRRLQLLLTKNGIRSSVNLLGRAGVSTNFGKRKEDLWYLQITDAREIPCQRVDVSGGHAPRFKGKYQSIRSVTPIEGLHDSYCFNEPETHMGLFANVLTLQCNLSEVIARSTDTREDLFRKTRASVMIGTIQATLTDFPYLDPKWKENCDEEALLGASVTGQMDCPAFRDADVQREMKRVAIEVNRDFAERLNIQQSAAITTGKPSGTLSLFVDSSSGCHTRWSKFGIRRVRLNGGDPMLTLFRTMGLVINVDPMTPNTFVVDFPFKAPDGAITRHDLDAMEQLEHWLSVKTNYTEHNQSATIYVRDDEWIQVLAWIDKHWDLIGGLSFLPTSDHVYPLAPFEEITEEQYLKLMEDFPIFTDEEFALSLAAIESEDNTTGASEVACVSGQCDVN